MAWVETTSPSFTARHESGDRDEVALALEALEHVRDRLARLFPVTPGDLGVVFHRSRAALWLAMPSQPVTWALTAPAGRRYLVGGIKARELHVITPHVAAKRASAVPGSAEMLALAPAALYARLTVAANNPRLPPPLRAGRAINGLRWSWLAEGAASTLSGQSAHLRPAIARRLHEGRAPRFPPSRSDAPVLGGTVLDLVAQEVGEDALVAMCSTLHPDGPRAAITAAFGGALEFDEIEAAWRQRLVQI